MKYIAKVVIDKSKRLAVIYNRIEECENVKTSMDASRVSKNLAEAHVALYNSEIKDILSEIGLFIKKEVK